MTATADDFLRTHPDFVLRPDGDDEADGRSRAEIDGALEAAGQEVTAYLHTSGAPIDAPPWLDQAVIDIAACASRWMSGGKASVTYRR